MSAKNLVDVIVVSQASVFGAVFTGGSALYIVNNLKQEVQLAGEEEDTEDWAKEFEEIKKEAEKARQILDDYSFKILLPCQTSGTGWILDYEIPKEGHYPRKWYIATNAHVANHFRFANDDYGQELPISKELRDVSKNQRFPNLALDNREACGLGTKYGYFDFNLLKQENGGKFRSNYGAITNNKTQEPKLFYAPINFLNPDKTKGIPTDNYKDFAVIEVEFNTESDAKEATGDFYGKYIERKEKDPLNVLKAPTNKEKNPTKSENEDVRVYSLGYEGKKGSKYTFSYDNDYTTSWLAKNRQGFSDSEGRVSATKVDETNLDKRTEWNKRRLNSVGYLYLLYGFPMGPGASGGLVIDKDGNVLGLRNMGIKDAEESLVVPLRSEEIKDNGIISSPAYDLINGNNGQKSSYREQVEEYILKQGRKTWLSEKAGWKCNSQVPK